MRVFNHLIVGFPLLLEFGGLLFVYNWHNYRLHNKDRFVDYWQGAARPVGDGLLRLERDRFESVLWHN